MTVLFYGRDGKAEVIQRRIRKSSLDIEFYRTIEELTNRFRRPLDDPTIAILVADTGERLEELLARQNLFRNVRIILILPDTEPSTIAKGHNLQARFLTCIDSDPAEVALVLDRMAERASAKVHRVAST